MRGVGVTPILVTSIVRGNFDGDGKIKADSLVPYVDAVRQLAAEKSVPLIDLYALTLVQAERSGRPTVRPSGADCRSGSSIRRILDRKARRKSGPWPRELVRLQPELKALSMRQAQGG